MATWFFLAAWFFLSFCISLSTTVHLNWTSFNCHLIWVINTFLSLYLCFWMSWRFPLPQSWCPYNGEKMPLQWQKKKLKNAFPAWDILSKISSNQGTHSIEQTIPALMARLADFLELSLTVSSSVIRQGTNGKTGFKQDKINYTGLNELIRKVTISWLFIWNITDF